MPASSKEDVDQLAKKLTVDGRDAFIVDLLGPAGEGQKRILGAMLVGFGMGAADVGLPGVEAGTLASVVVLAALAVLAVPMPLAGAAVLVAVAGLLHGHAHGTEGAATLAYMAGFLVATAGLIGAGLALAAPLAPFARRLGARVRMRAA